MAEFDDNTWRTYKALALQAARSAVPAGRRTEIIAKVTEMIDNPETMSIVYLNRLPPSYTGMVFAVTVRDNPPEPDCGCPWFWRDCGRWIWPTSPCGVDQG